MTTPLKQEFLRAYVGRSLEIDCPRIVLRQAKTESPRIIEGPGLIAQDEAGQLLLRMFPRDVSLRDSFQMLFANARTPAGVLLPPDAFYALEGVDVNGHTWTCPRVRPQMSSGPGGAIIRAEVDPLLSTRPVDSSSTHWLRIVFPEKLKLAWNQATQDIFKAGDRTLHERIDHTRAEFTVDDLSFEVQRHDEDPVSTTVIVRSQNPLPPGIEWRVREAFRFMLFRGMSWGIAEIGTATEHRIQIVPPESTRRNLLQPPLQASDPHEDYWRLFGAYLRHVCKHNDPSTFHALSGQLSAILDVQNPHIEILALLLGITVEGVLNLEYADLANPAENFLADLNMAPAHIQAMPCGERIKARLRGALSGMRIASVKDKLYELEKRGLLSKSSIQAWEKLRHKAAHATHLDPLEHQEHLNRCHKVHELLLTLIYIAVGYEGRYRQYSAENWPLASFPPDSPLSA